MKGLGQQVTLFYTHEHDYNFIGTYGHVIIWS